MSRNKGGRPPKAGPRKPCGRLREVNDIGSLELLGHRALAVQPVLAAQCLDDLRNGTEGKQEHAIATLKALGSDRRAESQLGILFARHVITGQQHYAGSRYAGLAKRATTRIGQLKSTLGNLVGPSPGQTHLSDEDEADIQVAYLDARTKLRWCGDRVAAVVDGVAIFDEHVTGEKIDQLKIGLNSLIKHFERG